MNKREYKQITSILLERVRLLKAYTKDLKKAVLEARDRQDKALARLDARTQELTSMAAHNAELSAKCKALEVRDTEVAALRQQHAESYTRDGIS